MLRKAYIIVFDKGDIDAGHLHTTVVTLHKNGTILNWWHHIHSCYILISGLSANDLSAHIANSMQGNKKFFITEINLNNRQGWLPQDAWEWIKDETLRIQNRMFY